MKESWTAWRSRLEQSGRDGWIVFAVLMVITFAALLLRVRGIAKLDLWYDELALWFYSLTGDAVAVEAPHEPPLMAALVYFVMWWVQDTAPVWSHLVAAVFGTLTIPLAYVFASRLDRNPRTGFIVASLVALSPMSVFLSREARPYALFVFVTTALYLAFLRAYEDRHKWSWALYGVCLALACLSHLSTVMLIVALGLTALLLLIHDLRRPGGVVIARSWFVGFAVSSVLGAAAGSWWILHRRVIAAANGYSFTYTFTGPSRFGPMSFLREILINLGPGPMVSYGGNIPWGYAEVAGAVFLALFAIGLRRLISQGQRAAALLLGMTVAVSVCILYITIGRRWGIRYIAHVAVPYLAVIGLGVSAIVDRLPSRVLKTAVVIAVLALMLPVTLRPAEVRPEIAWYRETARYTQAHANELQGVLVLPYTITQYDADLRITNMYGILRQDLLPLYNVSWGQIMGVKQVRGRFGFGTVWIENGIPETTLASGRYAVLSRRPFDNCQTLAESLRLKPTAEHSIPIVQGLTVCDFTFKTASAAVTSAPQPAFSSKSASVIGR